MVHKEANMQIQNKGTLRDDLSSSQRQKVSALKSSNSEPQNQTQRVPQE